MTRKISQELQEEVYTALNLVLMQHPEGAGPTDIWEALFEDRMDISSVSRAISELVKEGYVKFVGFIDKRKKFISTDKEFLPVRFPCPAVEANAKAGEKAIKKLKNDFGLTSSNSPAEPGYWLDHLNKVVDSLCKLQDAIPGLKVGLLDLTKNLDRLSKVKDILGDMAKTARRNV